MDVLEGGCVPRLGDFDTAWAGCRRLWWRRRFLSDPDIDNASAIKFCFQDPWFPARQSVSGGNHIAPCSTSVVHEAYAKATGPYRRPSVSEQTPRCAS
jgi:hypothetical protein